MRVTGCSDGAVVIVAAAVDVAAFVAAVVAVVEVLLRQRRARSSLMDTSAAVTAEFIVIAVDGFVGFVLELHSGDDVNSCHLLHRLADLLHHLLSSGLRVVDSIFRDIFLGDPVDVLEGDPV